LRDVYGIQVALFAQSKKAFRSAPREKQPRPVPGSRFSANMLLLAQQVNNRNTHATAAEG